MKETWAAIVGFPDYEVSTFGAIDRLRGGNRRRLSGWVNNFGYIKYGLSKNGKSKHALGHRMVLITFIGPPPDGFVCGHLDGNPGNNRLDNLKWVSLTENQAHRKLHGTDMRGEQYKHAKLTESDVREIRRLYFNNGTSHPELAKRFKVSRSNIGLIVNEKSWKHVKVLAEISANERSGG